MLDAPLSKLPAATWFFLPLIGIEDGEYYLDKARQEAVTVSMYNTRDISTSRDGHVIKFEVNLPPSIVERLENINLIITHLQQGMKPSPGASLAGFVGSEGFERVTDGDPPMRTFVNKSSVNMTTEDITIGDGFGKYLNVVMKASEKGRSLEEALQQQAQKQDL